MAKIKLTKTELKAQSDALKRYMRFLPMLQLKKQQLQAEIAQIYQKEEQLSAEIGLLEKSVEPWAGLLAADGIDTSTYIKPGKINISTANIAGVMIPVFNSAEFETSPIDLFSTPAWIDDAIAAISKALSLKAHLQTLRKQRELVTEELSVTSQRVNLFEKVKIPECKENIRVIKIAIGDEQTAAVTRGKIAKARGAANGAAA